VPRFAGNITVAKTPHEAWNALQDASVWGAILGAHELSSISHTEEGHLQSCEWMAHIAGSRIEGTFAVKESVPGEKMSARLRAPEWRGAINVGFAAGESTTLHITMELDADGFTALLVAPVVGRVIGEMFPRRLEELAELIGSE
jgi:carbon monoxide dehydrogenase subunit G